MIFDKKKLEATITQKALLFYCIFALCMYIVKGQVGINTTSPLSVLDVAGKTTLRKEFRVGGTSLQIGNAGLNGQVLVSQGEGLSPVWKSLNVSFMEEGQYKLIDSYLSSDQIGITNLSSGVAGDNIYKNNTGDILTDITKGKWSKIAGLENNFNIKNGKNRLTYQFQTGVEMKASSAANSQSISFTCGIFRNGHLVAVRPDKISSNNNMEKAGIQDYIFTLNYTEQDIPVGSHTIEVACRKIDTSTPDAQFVIGRNISDTNQVSNAFTLESMVKVDVIEFVTYKTN